MYDGACWDTDVNASVWLLQFQDIVVSVARKTDAAMWPALFLAVGVPSELLNNLVNAGALASAACCLLIVDRIEGSAIAHSSALRLIKARSPWAPHVRMAECEDIMCELDVAPSIPPQAAIII